MTGPFPEQPTGHATEPSDAVHDGPVADGPPRTGDLVLDAALAALAEAPGDDLDARLAAGEDVQRALRTRLGDLGG
ncbi:MAG TPA: hypothetical protein VES95_06915 [Dermatophilaceae bacterium]|nr:hypothetical protein [Dermatophilaceae bacterium]